MQNCNPPVSLLPAIKGLYLVIVTDRPLMTGHRF